MRFLIVLLPTLIGENKCGKYGFCSDMEDLLSLKTIV
ncbi:unknown [Lachnospiraceae bacterium CAG:215]|nr:unknown [Lachnospiraceae bacterium CAG:215]